MSKPTCIFAENIINENLKEMIKILFDGFVWNVATGEIINDGCRLLFNGTVFRKDGRMITAKIKENSKYVVLKASGERDINGDEICEGHILQTEIAGPNIVIGYKSGQFCAVEGAGESSLKDIMHLWGKILIVGHKSLPEYKAKKRNLVPADPSDYTVLGQFKIEADNIEDAQIIGNNLINSKGGFYHGVFKDYGRYESIFSVAMRIVAKHDGVDISDVEKMNRKGKLVQVRQRVYWLLWMYTRYTQKIISERIGDQDHSIVVHSVGVVNNMIKTNRKYREDFEKLERKFQTYLLEFERDSKVLPTGKKIARGSNIN